MQTNTTSKRLLSLDTLRGFDMFWIAGGEEIIRALAKISPTPFFVGLDKQFHHVPWHGFVAYDLIFPLFLFLAGVSTPYSIGSRLEKGDAKSDLAMKAIRRGLILVFLGIIYNNGIFQEPFSEMRIASVLARIGLAGMFAQLIYIYLPTKGQWGAFAGLLIGYYLFMAYYPVPGCGAGLFTMECNPASYFDTFLVPGVLYKGIHDPEGLVSTIPAIGTALLGIFAGNILRSKAPEHTGINKTIRLLLMGSLSIGLALAWDTIFPINKNLWTSSFTLMAGGCSLLLLALFYYIIDVKLWQKWTFFFIVIGMNSIIIYMVGDFINFNYTADALFGGIIKSLPETLQEISKIVTRLAVLWGFMYLLYKNKIFLKI